MHVQPTLVVNVDTTALARLIGKRKWDKSFKELRDAAEQAAGKDVLDKIHGELSKKVLEMSERRTRHYTKTDGTAEGPMAIEWTDELFKYKQERLDFYLNLMVHLIEEEIKSRNK